MTVKNALIVGAGPGLSSCVARKLAARGVKVALAARSLETNQALAEAIDGRAYRCDASKDDAVGALFEAVDEDFGAPDFVLYNASARSRGPLVELDPNAVEKALLVSAFGGFLVAQEAARRMLEAGGGAIFFTGASASVKGYPQSAPFAMGKFALRGLAQSIARELQPKNIHVAHFVIDGAIRNPGRTEPTDKPDSMLNPDAIADTYLAALDQDRSAWTWEIELRPWVERF
jgi:NAD(P)-dependent dehydrogenase (short-subunit alcohol dehydrogenase family)